MLDSNGFDNWCRSLRFTQTTYELIQQIRTSAPSRRVQGGKSNVSGSYPSKKMGVTIQFESHRNELARIYELENDPDVLEFYDQPPPIELIYQSKNGRWNRHRYTADFFVIRTNWAGWEECKTEQDLIKLNEANPNRYCKNEQGQWCCPPGNTFAQQYGLQFQVRSDAEINWVFQQNFIFLEDYFGVDANEIDQTVVEATLAIVKTHPGICLAELLQQTEGSADDIYTLIATDCLYVDLNAVRFSEPESVRVFLNEQIALAHDRITETKPLDTPDNFHPIQVTVGSILCWDDQAWEVINTGTTTTGLLGTDGKLIDLPNTAVAELIQKGKVSAVTALEESDRNSKIREILQRSRPEDIEEANRRYEAIQPFLNDNSTGLSRTLRRWCKQYKAAEKRYGNGYIGLIPKDSAKGNRTRKVEQQVLEFMNEFIEENYENVKNRRVTAVYRDFVGACESHNPKLVAPSRPTFTAAIRKRSGVEQTRRREGRRAAIQKEAFYWELSLTTPKHGNRPFEIAHIDHTQLDIELVCSIASLHGCKITLPETAKYNLDRPWATFMVDAYSRRLLAIYLTYDEPSYRSCMMVLRICVQRHQRLPQTIVVDNGAEFHSIYFETLLAMYRCTKKYRPPAKARFGSVVERLFGTANTQLIHELQGNTQITRKHRQVTRSVNPQRHAIWTIGELYQALSQWAYEIYDQRLHPSIGQSPREAFIQGLALGGAREHKRVQYDETFRILTLPAPERGKRKVQPGQGVKINNIYYWTDDFRNPEIEKTQVEVRYDPFDAGVAYALIRGKWSKCLSNYYSYLHGRTEKEIRIATEELLQRKRQQGRNYIESDRELVQFLDSLEAKEGKLLQQQLKAMENRSVLDILEGLPISDEHPDIESLDDEDDEPFQDHETEPDSSVEASESSPKSTPDDLEFFGEF